MFKHLAANPNTSKGRLYNEDDIDLRNPFERDRARVIHSNSFRKLKYKTQICPSIYFDSEWCYEYSVMISRKKKSKQKENKNRTLKKRKTKNCSLA